MLQRPSASPACREYALTALAKLAPRFPGSAQRIRGIISSYSHSPQLEVQTRSVEYGRLFEFSGGAIARQVLERIPPLDETAYDAALEPPEPNGAETAAAASSSASAAADLAALLGLDAGLAAVGSAAAAAPAANSVAALSDLLAGGDLLGGGGGGGPAAAAASWMPQPAAAAAATDPLAGLFGGSAAPQSAAPAAPPPPPQTITAYQSGPLTVRFQLEKPAGNPAATDILASYANSGSLPLEGFTLQAAVPKQMQLRLDPASATSLPPHSSGAVTQRLHVQNSVPGKALVMRLRISYQLDGRQVQEQGECSNFPPGY